MFFKKRVKQRFFSFEMRATKFYLTFTGKHLSYGIFKCFLKTIPFLFCIPGVGSLCTFSYILLNTYCPVH